VKEFYKGKEDEAAERYKNIIAEILKEKEL
jgi:hypothetical protein